MTVLGKSLISLAIYCFASLAVSTANPLGKSVYHRAALCASCHQADGKGTKDLYPPLAQSPWVTGNPERLIKLVLIGMDGEIEIQGRSYGGPRVAAMAGFRETIPSNEEMAALLTYIRQEWGNQASAITPDQIAEVKQQVASRYDYWTPEELLTMHPLASNQSQQTEPLPLPKSSASINEPVPFRVIALISATLLASFICMIIPHQNNH